MIRRYGGLLVGVLAVLVLGAPGAAAQPGGERMLSYTVAAEVRTDGSVAVTERIGDSYSSFTSTVDSSAAGPISVHSSTGSSSGWSSGSSGFDSGGSSGGGGDGGGGGGAGSW